MSLQAGRRRRPRRGGGRRAPCVASGAAAAGTERGRGPPRRRRRGGRSIGTSRRPSPAAPRRGPCPAAAAGGGARGPARVFLLSLLSLLLGVEEGEFFLRPIAKKTGIFPTLSLLRSRSLSARFSPRGHCHISPRGNSISAGVCGEESGRERRRPGRRHRAASHVDATGNAAAAASLGAAKRRRAALGEALGLSEQGQCSPHGALRETQARREEDEPKGAIGRGLEESEKLARECRHRCRLGSSTLTIGHSFFSVPLQKRTPRASAPLLCLDL